MAVTGCPAHIGRIFKGGAGLYRAVDATAGVFYGENSLVSLEGEAYAHMRRLLMVPILRHPASAAGLMRDAALRAFADQAVAQRFGMLDKARAITLDVILGAVFGVLDERERLEFVEAIHGLQGSIGFFAVFVKALRRDFGPWSPWGRFVRARAKCYALIEARIAAADAAKDDADGSVLAHWVSLRDPLGGPAMTRPQIRDNLLTLLFAGHDSTAVALAWSMYWTHCEPGILITLLDELEGYAGTLDIDLLGDTPYLDAVCREALRMHPVAPGVARRLNTAMELGGFNLPAGDVVMACIDLASHDPAIYPDPHRFRPERYFERNFGHDEFLPFGGGERRCPGASLAFMETRVALATLVCKFRFKLMEKPSLKACWSHGIRRPETSVRMMLEGRS